jgi:tetratricopeptide (TPR) repeat protein
MLTQLQKLALICVPCSLAISTAAIASLVLIDTSVGGPELQASTITSPNSPHPNVAQSAHTMTTKITQQVAIAKPETLPAIERPDPFSIASQHFQRGEAMQQAGHTQQALEQYAQALDIAKAEGHRSFESAILHRVAQVYGEAQDMNHAKQYYQEAIALARDTENDYVLGEALANLGQLSERQGQTKQALAYYQEALPKVRAIGYFPIEQRVASSIDQIKQQQIKQQAIAQAKKEQAKKAEAKSKQQKPPQIATDSTKKLDRFNIN